MCFNLLNQIEAKSVSIATERVWNEPWPAIQVRYRNLTKAYFRIVAWDYEQRIKSRNWQADYLDEPEQRDLLARKPTSLGRSTCWPRRITKSDRKKSPRPRT